ncbi:creatininase family protein [Sediminicola luteus]|uniref:creatininase family protein n=1 Tax=Sediminicola luteus TaxID=319238 RepID=UPI001C0EF5DE|nr:creatininase family protein [Sediminicola luteus]
MIRPYVLAETNWKHLKDAQFDLAILPWGATEAHNYHLPYATDNIEAEQIAIEAARIAHEAGGKVIVLPTIPFGVNTGQSDIFLDMNLNPSTQQAILKDLITVLDRQGVHKLLVFNSHGGNSFKTMLRELGLVFPKMLLAECHWFKSMDRSVYFDEPGDHADEMESSLIMHLRPDLVLPLEAAGNGAEKKHKIQGFQEGWAWMEREWSAISADTGVGDPKAASAEKGQRFFKDLTQKLAGFFSELAAADPKDLYD